jgi:hypothetical protein
MQEEIWKKHKSGYFVSNFGRIRGKYVEFLKKTITPSGYEMCGLGLVHRIVYETFFGEIGEKMEINHKDLNKLNNCVYNLECVTSSENQKHAVKEKKYIDRKGEKHPLSELKEIDVLNIYKLFKEGKTNDEVANVYNIHSRYVSLIRHGKRWKHTYESYYANNLSQNKSMGFYAYDKKTCFRILDDIVSKKMNNTEIAKKYNCDQTTICKIKKKQTWKNVWKIYNSEKLK